MKPIFIESVDLASFGEEHACRLLKKNGFQILQRNFRIPSGEVDIVARKGKLILFVEVKTRFGSGFAEPWHAVGYRKRRRLRLAAKAYIQQKNLHDLEFRFDIISITVNDSMKPEMKWIQAAF